MRWTGLWLTVALLLAGGCSMLVDASDVDEGCPADMKLCGGFCVAVSDPAYGCGATGCDPCELTNAIPTCNLDTHRCEVEACWLGFACPTDEGCKEYAADDPDCAEAFTQP